MHFPRNLNEKNYYIPSLFLFYLNEFVQEFEINVVNSIDNPNHLVINKNHFLQGLAGFPGQRHIYVETA